VTSIRLTGETVEVVLDIGIPLRASIARDSLVRMGLAVGGNTYLSFKATAVKIF
jgi:molybdopterin-binding protein